MGGSRKKKSISKPIIILFAFIASVVLVKCNYGPLVEVSKSINHYKRLLVSDHEILEELINSDEDEEEMIRITKRMIRENESMLRGKEAMQERIYLRTIIGFAVIAVITIFGLKYLTITLDEILGDK